MGIFDKLFGPSEVEKLKGKRDVQGLIGKINLGYRGCSDVCEALGQIGDERAVAPLIEVLERSKDNSSRKTAATALGQIGDERAVTPLSKILENPNSDGELCLSIVNALKRIGGERAINVLLKARSEGVHNPRRGKKDPIGLMEVSVEQAAAYALWQMGEQAIEPLTQALKDKDERIRFYAIEALAKIGDVRAVGPLTEALKDVDKGVRKSAEEAIENIRKGKER